MADLINNALAKVKQQTTQTLTTKVSQATIDATSKQQEVLNNVVNTLNEKLQTLPNVDDTLLIARQKEAEFFEKKKQIEERKLEIEEQIDEVQRQGLKNLALKLIPFPPKLPALDPKILATVALFNKRKLLRELRKKIAELNQIRSAKINKYPLRNVSKQFKNGIPKIPEVPKIPNLPLPTIPKLQTVQLPKELQRGIVKL